MKNNLNKFNHQDAVAVITSYPNKPVGKSKKRVFNAVAWHSAKTLKEFSKTKKVIVLAEKTNSGKKSFLLNKNLLIKRIWSKNSHFSILNLAWEILKLNKIKTVYITFEFNLLGGTIHNLLFLIVLFLLKLNQKRIVIEVHQVIEDIQELKKHINIKGSFLRIFYNFSLKIYYLIFGILANNIIVFEQELKNRLMKYIPETKISILSLSTQKNKVINQTYARKKLGLPQKDYLVMVFGFINGYKGLDFIIDAFSHVKAKNIKLIIAGGANPYLKDKKFYQKFFNNIMTLAKANKKIIITGFVPDNKVGEYFAAADLVVLPYEVFMSASGPFSLALSYNKPVILSDKLMPYNKSEDFSSSLKTAGLGLSDIFFALKKDRLIELIHKIKDDKKLSGRLNLFSKIMSEKRSSGKINENYLDILFPNTSLNFNKRENRLKLAYN